MKQEIDINAPVNLLLLTLLIALLSFTIVMLIGSLIAVPLFGIHPSFLLSPSKDLTDPSTIPVMKYFQMLQTIGLFILPPFLIAIATRKNPATFLKLNKLPSGMAVIYSISLIFATAPFIYFVGEWNANLHFPEWLSGLEKWLYQTDQDTKELVKAFLKTEGTAAFIYNLIMIAILPALGEEFLFRGIFQQQFSRLTRNKHAGVIIAACLFSVLHMQFSGFFPRFILGAMFGYLFLWCGSLWLPIAVHFVNNAFALIAHQKMAGTPLDPLTSNNNLAYPFYVTILSLLGSIVLLWAIYHTQKKEHRKN